MTRRFCLALGKAVSTKQYYARGFRGVNPSQKLTRTLPDDVAEFVYMSRISRKALARFLNVDVTVIDKIRLGLGYKEVAAKLKDKPKPRFNVRFGVRKDHN
jgi:hypothetical protein